ncbi:glycosyltransferase [candidate division KSB1 bacterium]|nr:glycosyltransferase [candidate division KSB1 bacterium]
MSVIIPTHNRAQLLIEALHSVHNQTHRADEILVIDDGSTDDTQTQVATEFPAVRLYYQTCAGVSAARNSGIRLARGEWLAFLDSDDLWKPEKLARQIDALQRFPEHRLCYTNEEWRKNDLWMNQKEKHRKFSGRIYARCLPLCIISPSSVLIHKSLFDEIGLFDETLPACEDYDLWLRITHRHPVLLIDERLIVKRAGKWPQLSAQHSLDKYRIIALQKMVALPSLQGADRDLTVAALYEKCRIYALGCRKHRRESEARWAEYIAALL